MPWRLDTRDAGKVLEVVYEGTQQGPELRAATHRILTVMLEQKIDRVVLDCSDARMEAPAVDVYDLPDVYNDRGISRQQVRAAVVLPKDGYKRELYEFYEDVCRNRGYFVKLFGTKDEAWTWIRSENPT